MLIILDNGSRYIQELVDFSEKFYGKSALVITFDGKPIPIVPQATQYVISGGWKFSVEENPALFSPYRNFFKNVNAPCLCVCLGMQLLMNYHGAKMSKMDKIRVASNFQIRYDNKNYTVFQSHQWANQDSLPKAILGECMSKDGWEIVRERDRPIIGVQFHPEKSRDGVAILRNILSPKPDKILDCKEPNKTFFQRIFKS